MGRPLLDLLDPYSIRLHGHKDNNLCSQLINIGNSVSRVIFCYDKGY